MTDCPLCQGKGKITVDDYSHLTRRVETCPVCLGRSKLMTVDIPEYGRRLQKEG